MTKIAFLLSVLFLLAGCASSGKYPVRWDQINQVGFSQEEVIELGQLVNIAYTLFDGNEADYNPAFPNPFLTGFKPMMNLQAEDDVYTNGKELYGHLSMLEDSPGTLVISIRGTSDDQEWIDDVKFFKEPFSDNKEYGRVELGFKEVFSSFTVSKPGDNVSTPLNEHLANLQNVERIVVVGHSLGSSLATLVAFDSSVNRYAPDIDLLTFASPLTGDKAFVRAFQSRIKDSLRIVNKPDIVPRVPPTLFGFRHMWHELEINSRSQSYIKHGLVCFHSLLTYLNILSDGRVAVEPKCSR